MRFGLIRIIFLLGSLILANQKEKEFKGYNLLKNFGENNIEAVVYPQNWSVVQGVQGILKFANMGGVLEYDGTSWNRIIINNNIVRSLNINKSGTVFVGGVNEIGYLVSDSSLSPQYFSLVNKIAPEYRSFSSVYQTYQNIYGTYYRSPKYLFQY